MSEVIAIDFETFYSKKLKYSLRNSIAEHYCKSHLFDPYLISASDGVNCWAGSHKDFNWKYLEGKTLLSHNAAFDSTVYEEMVRRGWAPKINFLAWHCTANLTAFLCNRRALDHAVEYLFGVKLSKVAREDANGKHWPADFSPELQKSMLDYAERDAFWCWKIWDTYSAQWPEHERKLSQQTINQGKRGVQIDVPLLNDYLLKIHEMKISTEQTIPWIANADDDVWEEFNAKPTSTKCIANQCRLSGIPCCPVKSDDEEAYLEWEEKYAPTNKWIYSVSAWRSVNKLYKTLQTVKERLRDDGTMPFALKYFGAHTGRWSGDAKINMQNMRKIPVLCNEHGLMEQNEKREVAAVKHKQKTGVWPEWVRDAIDFRKLIIARPGKKLIVSDLCQIEPRVLSWMARDTAKLDLLRTGMSVYEAHARSTMGWTGGKLKEENPDLYALAKARELALGYQAGWSKFIKMALTLAGIDITADDPEWEVAPTEDNPKGVPGFGLTSRKIVAEYRAQNKKVTDLWGRLDQAFKQSIGSNYIMTLPSGRKLRYEKVRCENRVEPDPETKQPRRKSVFTADVGGRRFQFYGGKFTENADQAISRDVFGFHLLAIDEKYGEGTVLFSSHDEAICEVDISVSAHDIEQVMSQCPEWLSGCPITAEAKEVACYTK